MVNNKPLKWIDVYPDFATFKQKLNDFSDGIVLDSDELFYKHLNGYYKNRPFLNNDEDWVIAITFEKWTSVKNKWLRLLNEKKKEITELIRATNKSQIFTGDDNQAANEATLKRFFANAADNEILPNVITFIGAIVDLPDVYAEIRELFSSPLFYNLNSNSITNSSYSDNITTADVMKYDAAEGFGTTASSVHKEHERQIQALIAGGGGGGGASTTAQVTKVDPAEGSGGTQEAINKNKETRITQNSSTSHDNTTKINTNKTDIATNKTDIATNKTDIATNTTSLNALSGTVITNTNKINQNIIDIKTNTDAIAGIGTPVTGTLTVSDPSEESYIGEGETQNIINIQNQNGITLLAEELARRGIYGGNEHGGALAPGNTDPVTVEEIFHDALKGGGYTHNDYDILIRFGLPAEHTTGGAYAFTKWIWTIKQLLDWKTVNIDTEYHFAGYPVEDNNLFPSGPIDISVDGAPGQPGTSITSWDKAEEFDKIRISTDLHEGLAGRRVQMNEYIKDLFHLFFARVTDPFDWDNLECDYYFWKGDENFSDNRTEVTRGRLTNKNIGERIIYSIRDSFFFIPQKGFYYWFTVVFRHPTAEILPIGCQLRSYVFQFEDQYTENASRPVIVTITEGIEGYGFLANTWDNRTFTVSWSKRDPDRIPGNTPFNSDSWKELKTTEEIAVSWPNLKPTHKAYTKDQTDKFPPLSYIENNADGKEILKRLNAHKFNDVLELTATVGTSTDRTSIINAQPKNYLTKLRESEFIQPDGHDPDFDDNRNIDEFPLSGVVPTGNKTYAFFTPRVSDPLVNKLWTFSPRSYVTVSNGLGVKKIAVKILKVSQAQIDNSNYQDIAENSILVAQFSNDDSSQDYTREPPYDDDVNNQKREKKLKAIYVNRCYLKTSPDKFFFPMQKGFYYIAAIYSNDTSVTWNLDCELYLTSRVIDEANETFEALPAMCKVEVTKQVGKPENQFHKIELNYRDGGRHILAGYYDTFLFNHPFLPLQYKDKTTPSGLVNMSRLLIKSVENYLNMSNLDNEQQIVEWTGLQTATKKGNFSQPTGDLETTLFKTISYTTDGGVLVTLPKGGIVVPWNKGMKGMKMKVRIRFNASGFNWAGTLSEVRLLRIYDRLTHPKHAEVIASFQDKVKTSSTTAYSSYFKWLDYIDTELETGATYAISYEAQDWSKGAINAAQKTPATLDIIQLEPIEYATYNAA